ncbi:hypothetical protein [Janthinobacterium sp.]|nr:hypothetical protein [Janthinobacterium sp.]
MMAISQDVVGEILCTWETKAINANVSVAQYIIGKEKRCARVAGNLFSFG